MDRYSVGSSILKNITDAFVQKEIENINYFDNIKINIENEIKKEDVVLKEIDAKILTIDDMLKDINS